MQLYLKTSFIKSHNLGRKESKHDRISIIKPQQQDILSILFFFPEFISGLKEIGLCFCRGQGVSLVLRSPAAATLAILSSLLSSLLYQLLILRDEMTSQA